MNIYRGKEKYVEWFKKLQRGNVMVALGLHDPCLAHLDTWRTFYLSRAHQNCAARGSPRDF